MIYQFNAHQFNSAELTLTHNKQIVEIRHNEAKLLAYLLSNSEKVVNKTQILQHVWKDKVVSEQAIFQNISHLRNIFGSDAIKTFPKRGYQWQLPFETTVLEPRLNSLAENEHTVTDNSRNVVGIMIVLAGLFSLLGLTAYTSLYNETPGGNFEIATFTMSGQTLDLTSQSRLSTTPIAELSSDMFLQSPESVFASLQQHHEVVLGGSIRRFNDIYYLDFLLKGNAGEWQGVVSGNSMDEINSRLAHHLTSPIVKDLVLNAKLPEVELAQLTIAQRDRPNDLIILSRLVDTYIALNQLDNALIMAEKLESLAKDGNSQTDDFYAAMSLLKQSEIMTQMQLYARSENKLESAMEGFRRIDDSHRLSDAWYANSWLKHLANDYEGIKDSLLKASELAAAVGDRRREIESLTYLSVLAHKHKQQEDKYHFLITAEEKMKAYGLPQFNFAKIPFHYAIFAENEADKVPHLKQVLAFTDLNPQHWVAQSSRRQLVEYYLKYDRVEDAKRLLSGLTNDNAQNAYLRTIIALAEGQNKRFIELAQLTFEKAQLAGLNRLSMDVALLLLQNAGNAVNTDFYIQNIEQKAPLYWRLEHKDELTAWL